MGGGSLPTAFHPLLASPLKGEEVNRASLRCRRVQILILSFTLLFSGCAHAGKVERSKSRREKDPFEASTGGVLFSKSYEEKLGQEVKKEVLKQYKLYDDSDLLAYVRRIGATLASFADRQDITYDFYVLDDPLINAFALPGGTIYITRGILTIFNNEAELAGVLGHEISHVVERHSMKHMQGGMATDLLWAVFTKGREMPLGIDIGRNLMMMSFGRGDELRSDALGMKYAYKAGYQADQVISVFQEFGRRDQSFVPEFLRSHPVDENRIAQLGDLWALVQTRQDIPPGASPLRTGVEEYEKVVFPHTYRTYFPQVESAMREMIAAVGRRDLEGMMSRVDRKFRSSWLNLSYKEFKKSYEDRFAATERITADVQFDAFRFLALDAVSALCRVSETRVHTDGRVESDTTAEIATFVKRGKSEGDTGAGWRLISLEDPSKW
ncbi:M48 family metalloprotease [bacterium]|nr:M48 family metalloprotease [bacterium]